MGMKPKTKAECDKAILAATKRVTSAQNYVEYIKATAPKALPQARMSLASAKGHLAELKALRKTLK